MKKVIIDKDKCIGCFRCTTACYSVFEIDEDAKAKVKEDLSKQDITNAEKAVSACPTKAIRIEGKDSIFDIFRRKSRKR